MPRNRGEEPRSLGNVPVAVLLALTVLAMPSPAGAADDPSGGTTPVPVSGVEGAKAALVRIEVSAVAEIAHIDHTTGEVNVARGRYEVPIRSGTGVFTSADGVIATTGTTLTVTDGDVVVYAANRLFTEVMQTALTGNDGDLSRRAQAVEEYWAPHLQHCYEQVEHCVLFYVPQYEVFPYTEEPSSTPADLLRPPAGAADVGLLQISGGGGTPTAELMPADGVAPAEEMVTGFTAPPGVDVDPSELAVTVDAATGALASTGDAVGLLASGVDGGPVLDPDTGQVAGLATVVDGAPTVVPVTRLHEVLAEAGVSPTASEFDVVFRRGIDHLGSERGGSSATSAFQEALTYYRSGLAAQYLQQAADTPADPAAAPAAGESDDGGLGGVGTWVTVAVVALLVLLAAVVLARRRRGGTGGQHLAPSGDGPPARDPAPATTVAAAPESTRSGAAVPDPVPVPARETRPPGAVPAHERTRLRQTPALATDHRPAGQRPTFCSDCGTPLRDGARFCGACGSPVT
jgi:hypothetical protein